MKKIIISLIIVFICAFGFFQFIKNQNIQQKIIQTQEQIQQDKNKTFVNILWENGITQRNSYFQAWKNLEITSMKIDVFPTQNLDSFRPDDYYTNSKNNELLDKIWIDNFLNNFENWKIFFLTPIHTFFGITQDYVIFQEDLEDYLNGNKEKLLKNKTQEYWELVNFDENHDEYLEKYQNNFEKYYEIELEVHANFSGSWEMYYYPYYDNHFYDGKNGWVWELMYENFVVDNAFYPYISLAEINNKNTEISTINSYEKYFQNNSNKHYKITYYNKKYVIQWNFVEWKNTVKINMFQLEREKMWYIQ